MARQVLRHGHHPRGHAARGAPRPHRPRQHQVRVPFPVKIFSEYFINFLKTGEEQVGERLRVQSVQQAAILQQVQQQGQEEEARVQDDTAAETLQVRRGGGRKWNYGE